MVRLEHEPLTIQQVAIELNRIVIIFTSFSVGVDAAWNSFTGRFLGGKVQEVLLWSFYEVKNKDKNSEAASSLVKPPLASWATCQCVQFQPWHEQCQQISIGL